MKVEAYYNAEGLNMMNKYMVFCAGVIIWTVFAGCAPVIVGGGAAGAYKVATDERSMGQLWDDSAIEARINLELVQSSKVNSGNIDVDVVDGIVILNGLVESLEEAKEAEAIAEREPHKKGVRNQLMIGTRTFGQVIDDNVIWNKIKGALINEKGIHSLNIDVNVQKGEVFLSGILENENQRLRVLKIAGAVTGVKQVTDNLMVKKKE
ncbi:MAG: BON domain-containing protein [Desulfobacteraceae bacterium]|nr:MAG: BON domain-containing protein [Desulfobacteraceae bacterium]